MKYVIFLILGISTLWQISFSQGSWLQFMLLSLISTSWVVGTLYIYDFIRAVRGTNSAYMSEFYGELKSEITGTVALAIALGVILALSSTAYSLSNIDIGYTGAAFLLSAFRALRSLKTRKVAGNRLPTRITHALLTMFLITVGIYGYYLVQINSNAFPAHASLWIQCTLLMTSICWCIAAQQVVFILKKQRMEISPVIAEIFDSISMSRGIYRDAGQMADKWNELVFQQNRQLLANKHSHKKKRKRKR
ncbi:hypothetical protein [Pseudomonas japonica]|uniref:Uncharacterized protein n=1 Tax=Pseudomonas japonica TaxID=256466 RepID=A0A239I482_9PSED|nr:hypothetical protein [Pseudomonas japonica]SNS88435.1 hypothetical protein SAMN05444352_117112 [Pseudomonas japonica]